MTTLITRRQLLLATAARLQLAATEADPAAARASGSACRWFAPTLEAGYVNYPPTRPCRSSVRGIHIPYSL